MNKSTKSSSQGKPEKPYKDFPLYAHATKRWAKKIRGKLHYFGPWGKPEAALEKLNREWPYLSEGRTPPAVDTGDGCTFRVLCNAFLNSKRSKLEADELSGVSFRNYYRICNCLVEYFGRDRRVDDLRPDDFEKFRVSMMQRLNVVSLKSEITWSRVVFNFAHQNRLISNPVDYGQSFNRPSAKHLRRARNEAGPKMFEATEIRKVLDAVNPVMKAMVLLGINAGFGNTDVATLPQSAVDLENGWVDFPRQKTEINRRCPLWQETVAAIEDALKSKPKAQNTDGERVCFLTAQGNLWVRSKPNNKNPDAVTALDTLSQSFRQILNGIGIGGHRNFYALRHTFETIGGESKDQVAVNSIMGHVDSSMAGVYRERISDERLRAVVDCVRGWLWANVEEAE